MFFSLLPHKTNISFVSEKPFHIFASIGIMVAIVIMLFVRGLNLGIDFTGGILIEASFNEPVDISEYRAVLSDSGYSGVSIQNFDANTLMIRAQIDDEEDTVKQIAKIKDVVAGIREVDFRKVEYVGPKIGIVLIKNGIISLILSFLGIALYIWFRFEQRYSIGAIIAIIHDVLIILGFYSLTEFSFDLGAVAAILTVVGYSVNDTVIIYDRIRENLKKSRKKKLVDVINSSLNSTLSRTIMTSCTTAVVCLALAIYGNDVIINFSIAVLIGVVFGTYSSIYIAAPVLLKLSSKSY